MSTENYNTWIPVKSRLPSQDGKYLVSLNWYSGEVCVQILCYTADLYSVNGNYFNGQKGKSGWYWYDSEYGYYAVDSVIAWMPLPDAYKGKEN